MKWKTIERALAIIASVITILTFAGGLVNKCSQHTTPKLSQDVVTTKHVLEDEGGSDVNASITKESEKEAFAQKWEKRKARFEEKEENGFLSMVWFLISYFPGLNILFILVMFAYALVCHLDTLHKGFDVNAGDLSFGFMVVLLICMPFYWLFIFGILK